MREKEKNKDQQHHHSNHHQTIKEIIQKQYHYKGNNTHVLLCPIDDLGFSP
jgi:hypothetical protein